MARSPPFVRPISASKQRARKPQDKNRESSGNALRRSAHSGFDQGKLPRDIETARTGRPLRRRARLEDVRQDEVASKANHLKEQNTSRLPDAPPRKRKRSEDIDGRHDCTAAKELGKRARVSATGAAAEDTSSQVLATNISDDGISPITYWTRKGRWPKRYFEEDGNMNHLLARKRSTTSLVRKRSDSSSVASSSTTPSDEKPREEKSAEYKTARYEILLSTKGSFMGRSDLGVADQSRACCQDLLQKEQTSPEYSLFHDDLFEETCEMIQGRNEAKVVQDIARLIVPSAQALAIRGSKHLRGLIESVNEGWNNSIPVTKTRPQPDYAVGFRREAFTKDQLNKIQPIVGELTDMSYFMATYYMYFPFLTCEVKCGAAALDIADRQNAHSMTLAVRAVVELFKLAKREKEVDREILAFSISHDHRTVRIYGHYAVIEAADATYYRHPVHTFDFTALDGKEKWTAYKFTKNVYDNWMPAHFRRICSVIDEFPPDLNFDVSRQSELQFTERSGMSQDLETYSLAQSSEGSGVAQAHSSQSSALETRQITPSTSLTEGGTFKRPRKDGGGRKRR